MDDSQARKFQKDLNAGLVALVLLAGLERPQEDLYGYETAKRLQKANQGEALFKEGTVSPVLRTLAAGGLLTSRERAQHGVHGALLEEGLALIRLLQALGDFVSVQILLGALEHGQQHQRHEPSVEVFLELTCLTIIHQIILFTV